MLLKLLLCAQNISLLSQCYGFVEAAESRIPHLPTTSQLSPTLHQRHTSCYPQLVKLDSLVTIKDKVIGAKFQRCHQVDYLEK